LSNATTAPSTGMGSWSRHTFVSKLSVPGSISPAEPLSPDKPLLRSRREAEQPSSTPTARSPGSSCFALAVSLCAALARYGHKERMAAVEREAIEGLERAAANLTLSGCAG
jgi:hypothetical protein